MISAGRNRSSSASNAASPSTSVVLKSPVVRSTNARPKVLPSGTDRGQKIIALGREHPLVEMRPGAEDLRDLAFDQLARPRFFHLVANGHLASGLEQAADVAVGRVKRNAAHRHHAAFGQRHIEQLRAELARPRKTFRRNRPSRKSNSASLGSSLLMRRYCAIIGVSCASLAMGKS